MDVEIPDEARDQFLVPFAISDASVRAAAREPDGTDAIDLEGTDGAALLVLSKAADPAGTTLLICGTRARHANGNGNGNGNGSGPAGLFRVMAAVPVPPDLAAAGTAAEPLTLLEAVAERYGRAVTVGWRSGRFICAERIPVPGGNQPIEVSIDVAANEPVVYLALQRFVDAAGGERRVACALFFALDQRAMQRALGLDGPAPATRVAIE